MSEAAVTKFSAADASLGYLYQIRSALVWTLRRLKEEQDFLVSVETLDDVSFETVGGTPTELLQTKHHRVGTGKLTDASVDLWKTLRIWFEGHGAGEIPETAVLYLVTTGSAPAGSSASYLRAGSRDVSAARAALAATALSSSNVANKAAYESFLSAGSSAQADVLNRVVVIDSSPTVTSLEDELRAEVYWATVRKHHTAFLERLEGWWLRRILAQLANVAADRVGSVEVEAIVNDLRDQFTQEALPIDDDLVKFSLDEESEGAYGWTPFRAADRVEQGRKGPLSCCDTRLLPSVRTALALVARRACGWAGRADIRENAYRRVGTFVRGDHRRTGRRSDREREGGGGASASCVGRAGADTDPAERDSTVR